MYVLQNDYPGDRRVSPHRSFPKTDREIVSYYFGKWDGIDEYQKEFKGDMLETTKYLTSVLLAFTATLFSAVLTLIIWGIISKTVEVKYTI